MTQYHVTLDGQGYVLDLDRYQKRRREPFVSRQAAGAPGYADLRGPEQVLVISDWSGGEGQIQHDEAPTRWLQGGGIDVYGVRGGLQLGPQVSLIGTTTMDYFRCMAVFQAKLFVGGHGGKIYTWDGSTFGLNVTVGVGNLVTMEVFENRLYGGGDAVGTMVKYDGVTWTAPAFAAGPIYSLATHYRQTAQYLYLGTFGTGAGGTGRAYYWDGVALSGGQYDFEEPYPMKAFVLGNRLYWVAADANNVSFGVYSVDDSGSGGVWRCHARVRGLGYPLNAVVLNDTAYIGDVLSGRIWTWDGAELKILRTLTENGQNYTGQLYVLAAWRGALWVGIKESGTVGVLRYDPSANDGQGGWSRPVTGLTGSDIWAMGVYNDALYLGTNATGAARVYRVSGHLYGASGQLESGLISFGLPGVTKLLRSITLVCSPLAATQSIQVEYRVEGTGAWTSLGTLSTVGATTATYPFPAATTCRQVSLRFTLSGTAGASSSPVLYEATIRYVPRPSVTREWDLAVVLEGTAELPLMTLDGATEPLTGAQLTSALWTSAAGTGPLSFVDVDGSSYSVYVDDVREEIGKISQRRGYQRLGLVRLVEAA